MSESSVRKYIKVWVKKRKNNPRKGGGPTVSRTLHWLVDGRPKFMSLGPHATAEYARECARRKEAELNQYAAAVERLDRARWDDFRKKYMDTKYPGHALSGPERKEAERSWGKSWASCRSERLALDNFTRIVKPEWVDEITGRARDEFVTKRLAEVSSAASVDADLRVLRAVFNVAEEWRHRPEESNPFAGRGKSTVGARRKRSKEREASRGKAGKHYTYEEVKAILALAEKEAQGSPTLEKKRLCALVHFVAYTGCRINEAVHLEWKDIDWEKGVAFLYFKVESDLKTEGSQAPFGLPDHLIEVLRGWEKDRACSWVFPNTVMRPWKTGSPGYRPFDQLQELGRRAGVEGANWKRFRHTISTLGKGLFGLTREQIRAQLRHSHESTQDHYSHDDIASLREAARKVDFRR